VREEVGEQRRGADFIGKFRKSSFCKIARRLGLTAPLDLLGGGVGFVLPSLLGCGGGALKLRSLIPLGKSRESSFPQIAHSPSKGEKSSGNNVVKLGGHIIYPTLNF
jgi:hypothetical protein